MDIRTVKGGGGLYWWGCLGERRHSNPTGSVGHSRASKNLPTSGPPPCGETAPDAQEPAPKQDPPGARAGPQFYVSGGFGDRAAGVLQG